MNFSRKVPAIKAAPLLFFTFIFFNANILSCTPIQKMETKELLITRASGDSVKITVEIAKTDEERRQGLMFREELLDGEGMLFVFERDARHSFWMKNTLIPLSIAFISSDGEIIEIKDMQPHNEDSVAPSRMVRYALEVPQGWFDRAGIKPGDTITGIK